uniref:Uncharacterized protein n=1 Tax=Panagrolaimus sp. JU765 TaxID=591449 RepID=A0AC34Q0S7_9BILA
MIADEIVHNSIPKDRIQFATTCKAFNQLVKDAKPKKIIPALRLHCDFTDVYVCINSRNEGIMTLPELKKILQQCQVETLLLCAVGGFTEHLFFKLMDLLMELCRFITDFRIYSVHPEFEAFEIFNNLRFNKNDFGFAVFSPQIGITKRIFSFIVGGKNVESSIIIFEYY